MFRLALLLAAVLVLLCVTPVVAQDPVLGQRYGSGVHAYFSQNYQQAYDDLSSAISAGSRDPRCYYFRGLSYLRLGREEEAQTDFQRGAELETRDVNKFYNVPAALERIQGEDRRLLERYRSEARLAALQREEQERAARYGQQREREKGLLESMAAPAGALPAAAVRANEQPGVFEPGTGAGPMKSVESVAPPAGLPAAVKPAAPPAPAPAEDPFATGAKPAPAGPAAAPATAPVGPAAAPVSPAAPAADDPFGATAPAAPVSAAPKAVAPIVEQPPAAEKPAAAPAEKPAGAGADPFAAPPAPAPADPTEQAGDRTCREAGRGWGRSVCRAGRCGGCREAGRRACREACGSCRHARRWGCCRSC